MRRSRGISTVKWRRALWNAVAYLAPGGVFLGVNRIQCTYRPRPLRFNGPLSTPFDERTHCDELRQPGLRLVDAGTASDLSRESKGLGYTAIAWAAFKSTASR